MLPHTYVSRKMRTITLTAYNRPEYLARTIGALAPALLRPDPAFFDLLIISVDPGNAAVESICDSVGSVLAEHGVIDCSVYVNAQKFGVAGNTFVALQRAFEDHSSEFNLSIEDDAWLTPDSVLLAKWFHESHGGPLSDYTLLSMCNHRDFGRGVSPIADENDPSLISEAFYITSPFAWCASKWQWPFIKASWNTKQQPPNGWDFSLSMDMRLGRRKSLHPFLSRCENIGRNGGENSSPETFDATEVGITHSDGQHEGPYRIAARVSPLELTRVDSWMRTEKEQMPWL